MEFLKEKRDYIILALFTIIAIVAIVLLTAVFKVPVVPVCIIIVLEVVISVLLHNAELWADGVVILIELISGVILGKFIVVLFCILVYIAAVVALKLIKNK